MQTPRQALAWMNFFILYVALPALFYRILAQTPLEKLAQVDFISATTLATLWAFSLSFAIGMAIRRGNIAEAAIAGLAGGYGNISASWARGWRWLLSVRRRRYRWR
jgi:malonate transporter